MKVLLLGRTGQVGAELERLLDARVDLASTDRMALDLAKPEEVRRVVCDIRADVIVNAAAYTAVDLAETQADLAMAINGVAPGILAEEARRSGALLVHYSTDYVFDGEKTGPYVEEDAPNPINVYGRSKLEGERRIAASGCRHLILRTSWIYGPHGRNFFITVARKALAGEPLRVVDDQHGTPSESRFVAETTTRLIERDAQGVVNVVPSGQTTWRLFAVAIVARLGLGTPVDGIASSEYPSAARRPRNSVLDHSRLASLLGEPPAWETLLERCVDAWKHQ